MIRSVAVASLCSLGALFMALPAAAVRLANDGLGQVLIYPYYSVRSTYDGNTWNTLISVASTRENAKVVKVRFREALRGRIVWEANVYLGPHDMWTGAVTLGSEGTPHVVTADISCVDPPHSGMDAGAFSTASFSGSASDGARTPLGTSTGIDRTLEGFAEVIEMGTLTGASAAAVTVASDGAPSNCKLVAGPGLNRQLAAPEGGLSGTGLLLNINNGLALRYEPVVLADLTREAFYSDPGVSGTDYDSPKVTPESVVLANGFLLRSSWSRGVDAVSAVLMAATLEGEYGLDAATTSASDWVVTLPTARFYSTTTPSTPPFSDPVKGYYPCELTDVTSYNREQARFFQSGSDFGGEQTGPLYPPAFCWATNTFAFRNGNYYSPSTPALPTLLLGSAVAALVNVDTIFQNGFTMSDLTGMGRTGLASLASSTTIDLRTGNMVFGSQLFKGLPVTGFTAWSFHNGLLDCSGQPCNGNFGVAYPLHLIRDVSLPLP